MNSLFSIAYITHPSHLDIKLNERFLYPMNPTLVLNSFIVIPKPQKPWNEALPAIILNPNLDPQEESPPLQQTTKDVTENADPLKKTAKKIKNYRKPWGHSSTPYTRKGKWSEKEDAKLRRLIRRYGIADWTEIAEKLGTRTEQQCSQRWKRYLNPNISHSAWSLEEDEKICNHVEQYGTTFWVKLADNLGNRTDKQCAERWHQALNPTINHNKWPKTKDAQLLRCVNIYGKNWTKITKKIKDKTPCQCRQRWNRLQKSLL
jgi:hypothetical protein